MAAALARSARRSARAESLPARSRRGGGASGLQRARPQRTSPSRVALLENSKVLALFPVSPGSARFLPGFDRFRPFYGPEPGPLTAWGRGHVHLLRRRLRGADRASDDSRQERTWSHDEPGRMDRTRENGREETEGVGGTAKGA